MSPREFAIQVVSQLQAAGFDALWAGGCVRDQLMGRSPKDYDVATNALPDQVRSLFGQKRTLPIGAAFGVITVIGPKSAGQIEVATFRRDSQYSDGRHPDSVEFSNALEDAQRRDFTINGMFYDPVKQQVLDYVGGEQDLQQKIIRAIGNPLERIHEDKLRMLRAVRFAATFGFQLENVTLQAIRREANKINQISAERIGNELVRMLSHPARADAVQWLLRSDLLPELLPDGWYHPTDWQGAALHDRLQEMQRLESTSFEPAACLLLRPCFERLAPATTAVGKQTPMALGICQIQERWKLTNQQRENMNWIFRNWRPLSQAESLRWSELQPLLVHEAVELALATARAIASDTKGLSLCSERLRWPGSQLNPPALIHGEDLIRLGLKPGPQFKTILQEIRDRQLEGELSTTQQAQQFVAREYG
jgi:poly(A) polymerase